MLMISARDDVDAYGVVTDPGVHRLAFDQLGPGEGFYLELGNVTHRWLGGDTSLLGSADAVRRPPAAAWKHTPSGPERRRRTPAQQSAQSRDAMAPEGEEEDPASEKKARVASAELEATRSRTLSRRR